MEVISLAALDRPAGPMVPVDADGHRKPLSTLAEGLLDHGLVRRSDPFHLASGVTEAVDLLDPLLADGAAAAGRPRGATTVPPPLHEVSST